MPAIPNPAIVPLPDIFRDAVEEEVVLMETVKFAEPPGDSARLFGLMAQLAFCGTPVQDRETVPPNPGPLARLRL
jgi:hypothetical protein